MQGLKLAAVVMGMDGLPALAQAVYVLYLWRALSLINGSPGCVEGKPCGGKVAEGKPALTKWVRLGGCTQLPLVLISDSALMSEP